MQLGNPSVVFLLFNYVFGIETRLLSRLVVSIAIGRFFPNKARLKRLPVVDFALSCTSQTTVFTVGLRGQLCKLLLEGKIPSGPDARYLLSLREESAIIAHGASCFRTA